MNIEDYLDRDDIPENLKEAIRSKIIECERKEAELQNILVKSRLHQAEVSAMLEASRAVLEYHKFDAAARFIFDSCKNLIGATAGYVALLSEDGSENELLFLESGGLSCTVDPSLPMPIRGLRAEVYNSGKAKYDNDFSNSEWMKYMPEGHVSLENVIFAPLIIEEKVVGLLGLANKEGGFTENDANMATAFGELAAIALYNSRTLESLENSEKRFRSLVETANDGIVIIQDWIKYVNPKFAEITGFSEEVIGSSFFDFVAPEYRELVATRHRKAISGEEIPERFEIELITEFGGKIPVEINISRIEYEGKPAEMGIIRDITGRKQLEQELIESEAKYRTLVERDPNMIFYIEGRVLRFVNQAFLDTLGYSKEELYAPHFDFFATIIPDQREMFKDHLIEILTGEDAPASYELLLLTKEAEIIPCLINLTSFESQGKQIIQGVMTDIRVVKEIEEELQKTQKRLEDAMQTGNLAWWDMDCSTGKVMCNEQKAIMLGYSPDEFSDAHYTDFTDLLHPDDYERTMQAMRDHLEGKKAKYEVEYRIRTKSGDWKWYYDVGGITERDEDGRPLRVTGVVVDTSKRKRAENALKMVTHSLRERVKELRCLYNISELVDRPEISLEDTLQGVIELTPPAWQYPEIACARIRLEDKEFKTKNFRETIWKQASDIFVHDNKIGALEVFYLEQKPDSDEGPFLIEERSLINAIAERIGKIIIRKHAEEKLAEYTENLEKMIEERTKALSESEERLKAILSGIGDLVTIQNKDLEIIWANQAVRDIWGDVIGKKCYEVYKEFDTCCPDCTSEKVFSEGKTFTSEQKVKVPDGKLMNTLVTSSPVRDADGSIVAVVEVVKDITARKLAEVALKKSESRLAEASRISHLGYWDWNIERNELMWSDEIYRIFGLAPQEFGATYEAFLNSVHPEDREFVRKSVDEALYDKKPYSIDHRIVLPNGKVHIVHEQAEVTFDETGRPIRMMGTVQDITERKQAEERIKESENRLSLIFNSVSDSILLIKIEPDDTYRVLSVNEAFLADTGYTEEQIIGKRVDEILPESEYELLVSRYEEVIRTGKLVKYERSSELPKGLLVFEIIIKPIFNEKGKCTHLLGIAHDITEQRDLGKQLIESEERYRGLYESSIDGIVSVDMDNNFIECNQTFAEILGYTKDELSKLNSSHITPGEFHEMVAEIINEQVIKRGYSDEFETELLKKDGTIIQVSARIWLIRDKKGNPKGTWGIVREVKS
jgi:PAS domain S-box-containing protein